MKVRENADVGGPCSTVFPVPKALPQYIFGESLSYCGNFLCSQYAKISVIYSHKQNLIMICERKATNAHAVKIVGDRIHRSLSIT